MTTPAIERYRDSHWLPRPGYASERQECILLIEDNEDAMFLVQHALQTLGEGRFRLVWANTLYDGLKIIAEGGVDLVLLDLGLPDSSGMESYAWVREISAGSPVIVLSGDTSVEVEFQILESGVEDYLVKDQVTGPLLLQSVEAALSASKQSQHSTVGRRRRFSWTFKG